MARLPTVLSPAHLPLAELSAARLDGELFPLDECFSFSDLPVGSRERAQALAAVVPRRAVVERLSAAWLHEATDEPPAVHTIAHDVRERAVASFSTRFTVREIVLVPGDVETIGGCRVTTAIRTLADLARTRTEWTAEDVEITCRLAQAAHADVDACVRHLADSTRLPGKRLAIERIRDALDAQPALTRYTS
ncbi:hypothetical protein HQQ80_02635 [Microbacteriaceae bacterium VKM Ac-2855]|nr:hypothetical protein [Microbacteriaceae bacterium VKM Ac-2855]